MLNHRLYRPEHRGTRAYRVYVIQHASPVLARTLDDADRIDAAARQFRDSLEKPSSVDPKQRRERASALGAMVWNRIEKWVRGARHLIVVPDDQLSLVPFSALVDANDNFVGAARSVTYVSGMRQLGRLTPGAATADVTPPVIFADPVFGGDSPYTAVASFQRTQRGRRY